MYYPHINQFEELLFETLIWIKINTADRDSSGKQWHYHNLIN